VNLANCSRCNKVFTQVSKERVLCPACLKEEEDNYLKIFHYMTTRPAATAQEIAEGTGVDLMEIYRYVRENRLRLVKTDTGIRCESCGSPISQGKICEKCRQKLSLELKEDVDKFKQNMAKNNTKPTPSRDPKYLKNYRNKDF